MSKNFYASWTDQMYLHVFVLPHKIFIPYSILSTQYRNITFQQMLYSYDQKKYV